MKRVRAITIAFASVVFLTVFSIPIGAAGADLGGTSGAGKDSIYGSLCTTRFSVCADPSAPVNGYYVGHDEPSVEFKSDVPGSGNHMTYTMTLPTDPTTQPNASGAGSTTWGFQLHPTFWFGLAMCDSQSAPEYTPNCTPNTDANNLVGSNPKRPDYVGKHPGTAYMELQFYGPGYVEQFEGFGCTAHQYCAAMTIDSRTLNQNTGVENTSACNQYILGGPEPINWAYITTSGQSQAPANPLGSGTASNPDFSAVNPNPAQDLFMNPGDRIRIHMHDTAAGFQINIRDLTTGQAGSMTASTANGFGHILYTPTSSTCQEAPYAFHPAYSTADPRGNVWTAHTYNVAMSDEIGHFENCLALDANFNCTQPGAQDASGLDADDGNSFCVPGTDSTLVKIDGCFSSDEDWDSQAYSNDWPGTNPNPATDSTLHPSPVLFTSPVTSDRTNYSTVAFETDLPDLEAQGVQANPPFCDQTTGANCSVPPNGGQFYPFFTTGAQRGTCVWQEGGNFIPGTIDHFGGSAKAEYGNPLQVLYPVPGFKTRLKINDFNSGDIRNPCKLGDGSGPQRDHAVRR
jgi:hypothetical protein